MPRKRRNRYKFTGKTHSKKGILISAASAVQLVIFLLIIKKASATELGLSEYYGSLGCVLLVFSVASLVLAIQSEMEEESFKMFPHLALLLSVLAIVCWGGTYISGLV